MLASIPDAHTEVVTSLSFSPHYKTAPSHDLLLCSTSGDDTAALWDGRLLVREGTSPTSMTHTEAEAGSAVTVPDNTTTPRGRTMCLRHHRGPVNHALFALHDTNLLLTCSDDRTVAMWDLRKPDCVLGTLRGFSEGVNKLMWLPSEMCAHLTGTGCGSDGGGDAESRRNSMPILASACDDGLVYIHLLSPDVTSSTTTTTTVSPTATTTSSTIGTLVDKFFVSTSTVNDMVLLPRVRGMPSASRVFATASEDGAVRTWRLPFDLSVTTDDRLIASLDEFSNPVNHLALVPTVATWRASLCMGSASRDNANGAVDTCDAAEDDADTNTDLPTTLSAAESEGESSDGCWLLAACSEHVFGVDVDARTGLFGPGAMNFSGHTDYVRGLEFVPRGLTSSSSTTTTASATVHMTNETAQSALPAESTRDESSAPLLLTVSDDGTAIEWSLRAELFTNTAFSTQANPSSVPVPAGQTRHTTHTSNAASTQSSVDDAAAAADEETDRAHTTASSVHVEHQYYSNGIPTHEDDDDADERADRDENDAMPAMQEGGVAVFHAQLHRGLIMASAVAPGDRHYLATGSETGEIKLWRVPLCGTAPSPHSPFSAPS